MIRAVIANEIITDNELCVMKLENALDDYLQDKETATQMEDAIEMAIRLLKEGERECAPTIIEADTTRDCKTKGEEGD